MSSTTPITIVGNLTDDPELRFTASGTAVVKFSVAVNRRIFDRQTSEWKDAGADYHRVTAWRQLAENVAASLAKGTRVIVSGDMRQHTWTDEKTQEKRSAWEINADAVGPELSWATATVTRSAKTGGLSPDDPWNTAQRERPAGSAMAGAAAGYGDEEPPF